MQHQIDFASPMGVYVLCVLCIRCTGRGIDSLLMMVPLPITRELLPITHPMPMTVVTATVTTVTMLVHLYPVAWMVALGVLAGQVVVVLQEVLGELLDKEIWLGVYALV